MHNGGSDTDVTPDELLDKIQSTVDEMLSEFHPVTPTPSPQPSFPPPPPLPADPASQLQELERHIPEPPKKLSPPPPPPEVQEEEKEEEPMLDVADAGPVNGVSGLDVLLLVTDHSPSPPPPLPPPSSTDQRMKTPSPSLNLSS